MGRKAMIREVWQRWPAWLRLCAVLVLLGSAVVSGWLMKVLTPPTIMVEIQPEAGEVWVGDYRLVGKDLIFHTPGLDHARQSEQAWMEPRRLASEGEIVRLQVGRRGGVSVGDWLLARLTLGWLGQVPPNSKRGFAGFYKDGSQTGVWEWEDGAWQVCPLVIQAKGGKMQVVGGLDEGATRGMLRFMPSAGMARP